MTKQVLGTKHAKPSTKFPRGTIPVPRYAKRVMDAYRHPNIIVRHAARIALATCKPAAVDNLYLWLDRCEPGWKRKRRVSWSDH